MLAAYVATLGITHAGPLVSVAEAYLELRFCNPIAIGMGGQIEAQDDLFVSTHGARITRRK